MKKTYQVTEILSSSSGSKLPAATKQLEDSQAIHPRKPAFTQADKTKSLDAEGKARSSKVRMIGPCGY